MRIIEETSDCLVIRQQKNYLMLVMGIMMVIVSVAFSLAYFFSALFQNSFVLVCAAFSLVFGVCIAGISHNFMEVSFNRANGKVTCVSNKQFFFPGISMNINPKEIQIGDVSEVARFTGAIGLILKDGSRIQYGSGGLQITEKLLYMNKLSQFLGVSIEGGVMQDLYASK